MIDGGIYGEALLGMDGGVDGCFRWASVIFIGFIAIEQLNKSTYVLT